MKFWYKIVVLIFIGIQSMNSNAQILINTGGTVNVNGGEVFYDEALTEVFNFEHFLKNKKFGLENFYLIKANYLIAQFYFISNDFSKALKTINNVLNLFNSKVSPFIYDRALVLNFLIHYELGNKSYAKNLYKKLIKKTRFVSIEKDIINSINNCLKDSNLEFHTNPKKYNPSNARELIIIENMYLSYLTIKFKQKTQI